MTFEETLNATIGALNAAQAQNSATLIGLVNDVKTLQEKMRFQAVSIAALEGKIEDLRRRLDSKS